MQWCHPVLQSKHDTRYQSAGVFRRAAAQIRIKAATQRRPYLSALSEGKGQREETILSKSTLPLPPSEPSGRLPAFLPLLGEMAICEMLTFKVQLAHEKTKPLRAKLWPQCQHMKKKPPQKLKKNLLIGAAVPLLLALWLKVEQVCQLC